MARGRKRRGGGGGGADRHDPKRPRARTVIVPVVPMVRKVPDDVNAVFAYPLKQDMARRTPEDVVRELTSGDGGAPRFKPTTPYIMFVPLSVMNGRSLVDIDKEEVTALALRSFAMLFLAQVVRSGARLYVSLRRSRAGVPIGYYWVLYERDTTKEPPPVAPDDDGDAVAVDEAPEEKKGGGGDPIAAMGDALRNSIQEALGQPRAAEEKNQVFTTHMSVVEWLAKRVMSNNSLLNSCIELVYQHGGADNGLAARKLSADQLRWWIDLSNFATPDDLAAQCGQLLACYYGPSEKELVASVREMLATTLNVDVAAQACAMAMCRDDDDVAAAYHAEQELLTHEAIMGIPKDGVDSFCIQPAYAHPRVLSRYVMPHMTPEVDRRSPLYLGTWKRARQGPDGAKYGDVAPSQEFYDYFMAKVGTTVTRIDSGQFELSMRDLTIAVRKLRSRMRDDPAALRDELMVRAKHLNEMATGVGDLPAGIREVMQALRLRRVGGESLATLAGRAGLSHGFSSPLESWFQWLLSSLNTARTFVHLHGMAAAIILIALSTARGDENGTLQPSINVEGQPATGKTMLVSAILKPFFALCNSIAHESTLAQTAGEHRRGGGDSYDEALLEAVGAENAREVRLVLEQIVRRSNAGGTRSGLGLQHATSSTVTSKALRITDDGKRVAPTEETTNMRLILRMSNSALSAATQNQKRRGFFFAARIPPLCVRDMVTRQCNPTDTVFMAAQASVHLDDALRNLGNLSCVLNAANFSGILPVNIGAMLLSYDMAATKGWGQHAERYRDPNPFQKFKQILAYSATLLGAILSMQCWINIPDPLQALTPFVDIMAMRELMYSTEEAMCLALDVLMGKATTQVMPTGMPYVIEHLRDQFRRDPTQPAGPGNPLVLTPANTGAIQHPERYAVKENFFSSQQVNDVTRIVYLGNLLRADRDGSELMERTVEVCICYLLAGPVCSADQRSVVDNVPSVVFYGNHLFVLRSLLTEPIDDDLMAFKARAFPPGTQQLVHHMSLDLDPEKPGRMRSQVMTYERYARILSETSDAAQKRRADLQTAEDALVIEVTDAWKKARGVGSWVKAVHAVAQPSQWTTHMLTAFIINGRDPADMEAVVREWVATARVAAVDKSLVSRATDELVKHVCGLATLKRAIKDHRLMRVANETLDGVFLPDCPPEAMWSKQRKRNAAYADMDEVEQQVEMGCMHPDALNVYSTEEWVPFDTDAFRDSARQHIAECGVPAATVPHRFSFPDHRRVLEELSMRMRRARGRLVRCINAYRQTDMRRREHVLTAVIGLAWEMGSFFAHQSALGGLTFPLTREHIVCFYGESFFDIGGAMNMFKSEFEEPEEGDSQIDENGNIVARLKYTVDTLLDLFIDITTAVVRHMVYAVHTRDAEEPTFPDTPGVREEVVRAVRECLPVPVVGADPVSEDKPSPEQTRMDVMLCALQRPDVNRFQVPVYADGTPVPAAAVDDRIQLHKVNLRRVVFQLRATDFFIERLLEALACLWDVDGVDMRASRIAVLQWMSDFEDATMIRRAYAHRFLFELRRAEKFEDATQFEENLPPALRMPPRPTYYPYAAEIPLLLPILGREDPPSLESLPANEIDWQIVNGLGARGDSDAVAAEAAPEEETPMEEEEDLVVEGEEEEEDEGAVLVRQPTHRLVGGI